MISRPQARLYPHRGQNTKCPHGQALATLASLGPEEPWGFVAGLNSAEGAAGLDLHRIMGQNDRLLLSASLAHGQVMFDQIEKLKREYTDKYVVVDAQRPELARFAGHTGQVKTVNMSGRALVEFDVWNNIGWYDIDVSFLTVVPKPDPAAAKPEPAKPAAKPAAAKPAAGEKKASAAELARAQGAAKPAAAAGTKKTSTADILAAARAAKAGGAAPAGSAAPATTAKPAPKPAATAAPSPAEPAVADPASVPHVTHEVGTETSAASPASRTAAGGPLPTTTAEKIAWCRQHDTH